MVEETIKTIKEAEAQADQLEMDADQTCAGILDDANVQAKELTEKMVAEARAKAQEEMNAAKEAGDQSLEDSMKDVEKEIDALKEAAKGKEQEAISAVIDALI